MPSDQEDKDNFQNNEYGHLNHMNLIKVTDLNNANISYFKINLNNCNKLQATFNKLQVPYLCTERIAYTHHAEAKIDSANSHPERSRHCCTVY